MKLEKTTIPGIYKNVLKNGDISWYGKYRNHKGQSVRKKIGSKVKDNIKNEKSCIPILENIKLKDKNKDTNMYQSISSEDYDNYLTLNQLADKYFDSRKKKLLRISREQYTHLTYEELINHTNIKKRLKQLRGQLLRYNKNVKPFYIGKMEICAIRKPDINNYIENDLGELPLSQTSKYYMINYIKTIINSAIKKDIIDIKNPFNFVKFKNPKKTRKRILDEKNLLKLLEECKKWTINPNVYLSVYLGVLTGGRSATVLNIKRSDIKIDQKKIELTNFKNNNHKYYVHLSDKGLEWLVKKVLPNYEYNEYLIRPKSDRYKKNPPQPMSGIPEKVYEIMDELFNQGINKKNTEERESVFNFHSIRRSIGSNLVKNGSSVYNVMKFLDHSSVAQTMDYLNIDSNDDIVELVNNIFEPK